MADEIIRNVIPNMKAVDLGDGTFAYATVGETAQDRGIATGGSNVTCIDTTKAWIVNSFIGDTLQVTVAGVEYHSLITANTANTITMNIIGAVVVAGDPYKIVSAVGAAATIADGADVTQGAIADAVVAAGAVGTLSAKLRRLTTDSGAMVVDLAAIEIINTAIQTAVEAQGEGDYATPTHTWPVIANVTTVALAANANRLYALFVNDGTEPIYLKLGVAAVMNQGIRLQVGGSYEMSRELGNLYVGAVNGICASGGMTLLVTEGV